MASRSCPKCGNEGRALDFGSFNGWYVRCEACGEAWTVSRDPDTPQKPVTTRPTPKPT